jgi:biopolymer transport protein ExbD
MKIRRRKLKSARIEMMPLIDIVFLLLVFFIYAMLSMAVHRGLTLDLPVSSQAVINQQREEPISLSIVKATDGIEIYLNKVSVELSNLPQQLLLLSQREGAKEKPGVLIFAEEAISYQQLYRVLDKLKEAGFSDISLQSSTE